MQKPSIRPHTEGEQAESKRQLWAPEMCAPTSSSETRTATRNAAVGGNRERGNGGGQREGGILVPLGTMGGVECGEPVSHAETLFSFDGDEDGGVLVLVGAVINRI